MSQEKILLERSMQEYVTGVQSNLDSLLLLLGRRIDLSDSNEGYYWDNCRDLVIRIKNQVNKLPDWIAR